MMMRRLLTGICVSTLLVSALSGCCWTQRGAAIGGGTGAGVGAIWAHNAGKLSSGEGALVGLAAGGLAGALIGDLLEHTKQSDLEKQLQEMRDELEARKAQLDKKDRELEDREAKVRELEKRIRELEREVADLRKKLEGVGGDMGGLDVRRDGDEIIISILGETLYASGKAELTAQGKEMLDKVMAVVKKNFPGREIMVRGHTDNQPIKHSGWRSNWELGAARSLGVLHYLMDTHGVKGEMISAGTYSYYRPRTDNNTDEGRRLNRRAEIVIMPAKKIKVERAQ